MFAWIVHREWNLYSHNKNFVHQYISKEVPFYMTTLTVHTVDRMKTSMKSTLPDTLDIFEMQRRRHDLAFFSTIKSWARMAKLKSQKPFLHGWHKGWLMYGWHNQGRHEFFPVLSLSQHCEWPSMHSAYLGYELFFLLS